VRAPLQHRKENTVKCPHCGERISRFSSIRPKRAKQTYTRGEHEYLVGERAHLLRRMEIFRNAGGEVVLFEDSSSYTVEEIKPAICQGCVEPHEVPWDNAYGHWHHNCELRKKCDAIACALYVCESWHRRYHNRVIAVTQIRREAGNTQDGERHSEGSESDRITPAKPEQNRRLVHPEGPSRWDEASPANLSE